MAIFSPTRKGRTTSYTGTLAEFQADGRIWGVDDLLFPSDQPGVSYAGDGASTFAGLMPAASVKRPTATALNTTAAATSAAVLAAIALGLITSTSAATVSIVSPTAAQLAIRFGGVKGVEFQFTVDNVAGASTITLSGGSGVTVPTAVITGSDSMTVLSGKVGVFRLYFVSATAVLLSRVQ